LGPILKSELVQDRYQKDVSLSCLSTCWTLVCQSNNTTVPLRYFICVLYIPYIQRTQDHWHCWICHVNWPNAIHISVCNL